MTAESIQTAEFVVQIDDDGEPERLSEPFNRNVRESYWYLAARCDKCGAFISDIYDD
jgi:hypothetical protein